MKRVILLMLVVFSVVLYAQQPYYNNVNLTLTGLALKSELSQKIINTHTTQLQYTNVWGVLQQTDLDPSNSNNVLLLYGYNDGDGNPVTDRTRNKFLNGGNTGEWNREHTYAQSLATPNMTTSSPGAGTDAHHLRACDVQMNGNRGNRKFATGNGNAGNVGPDWYPGNEWKGDVARMMMYMYLRYPSQCLPNNVGVGTSVAIDPAMINLFLDWNAQDAVSQYEENRNSTLEIEQGNRNPFIDNPYLATIIWGGTVAQDNWNMTFVEKINYENNFSVYPIPSKNGDIHIYFSSDAEVKSLALFSINGQNLKTISYPKITNNEFLFDDLPKGVFILKTIIGSSLITKKIVVN
ncbi:MAG: endonuclease [Flavobacteriales bacterium]|nr:MAG: endonuclease [Flavobacteriales bacterium]